MKKQLFSFCVLIVFLASLGSCKKSEIKPYSGNAKIQLLDSVGASFSFFYKPTTVLQDTFFLDLRAIGGFTDYDRPIKLVQAEEFRDSIIFDPATLKPIDTLRLPISNAAQANVQYLGFETPDMQKLTVLKAGQVATKIPVILLRHSSLKEKSYRLRIQVEANSEFEIGEKKSLAKTLTFSDRLERFYSWRSDAIGIPAYSVFGKYSTAKHQFMYDVIGEPIDEAWYKAIEVIQAQNHYKNLVKQALNEFNNDPANIASGKAPLREGGPSSPTVTFP